ncbi:hypothetical protein ACFWJ4_23065 [Kitasatospora sp. NPDC127067]|uniref:hypothetical protein n=1 Tax=Kitasatospora sp. NPDC127067 TaxID=3347126 RepID=UPI003649379F
MNSGLGKDRTSDSSISPASWIEEVRLRTVDPDGSLRPVVLRIGPSSSALIALLDDGVLTEISGTDYLDCLAQARRQLERDGRLLCCQGSRPDVHPSGQLRQFSNGRQAYVRFPDLQGEAPEIVDIFAPAEPGDVVGLEDQRAAIVRAWNARHPGHQI